MTKIIDAPLRSAVPSGGYVIVTEPISTGSPLSMFAKVLPNAIGGSTEFALLSDRAGSSGSGGIDEAPNDANTYGRHALAWTQVLPLTGGIITGQLVVNQAVSMGNQTSHDWNGFGVPGLQVGAINSNAIVAVAESKSSAFSTAITGSGVVNIPGGAAWGLYAQARNLTAGVATNEIDSFNETATAPDPSLPPNRALGITQVVPIALTVAAGGTQDSSIAIEIGSEGARPRQFLTGIYLADNGIKNYGLFIDANGAAGPGVSAVIKSKQDAVALQLQATGTYNPSESLLVVTRPDTTPTAVIKQDGTFVTNGSLSAATASITDPAATAMASLAVTCTGSNGANLLLAGNGATTPHKTIRACNGELHVINDAYNSTILKLTNAGALTTTAGLGVFGATPPAARPTITGSRGSATATVLASLLTALNAAGLLTDSTTA
jgi:hypothetical protein